MNAKRIAATVMMAALLMVSSVRIARTATAAPLPEAVAIERDGVRIGDVVAQGVRRQSGGCEFGRIGITTVVPYGERRQWLGIKLDTAQCQVVVNAKWAGLLEQGPQDVVGFLLRRRFEIETIPEYLFPTESESSIGQSGTLEGIGILATPGRKTSEQHVYSYGYGGQGDKLTHKYGGITFSWDAYNNAFLDNRWGSCSAANWTASYGWEWRVDSCAETSVNYQGWEVWHEGTGSYHCHDLPGGLNPCGGPTGYYHSLIDHEKGRGNGTSVCTFGYTGTLVLGPAQQILQGCS